MPLGEHPLRMAAREIRVDDQHKARGDPRSERGEVAEGEAQNVEDGHHEVTQPVDEEASHR